MAVTGTIFDIKKFAIHDGPGIRTTVFFKGCPLACWWCHNPEGRNPGIEMLPVDLKGRAVRYSGGARVIGHEVDVAYVVEELRKDMIFYDESGGGVTISGGEPMMQIDFLAAVLTACREAGISTAVDTCGYAPVGQFERIYDSVDIFLYDVKIIDDDAHVTYTGLSNELILTNMAVLSRLGGKVVPRIALIPGITDTADNLRAIVAFLGSLENIREVSILPYNTIGEDKYTRYGLSSRLNRLPRQAEDEIDAVRRLFESHGYTVDYGG